MPTCEIIIDVNRPSEVQQYDDWLREWQSKVKVLGNTGCGCCVHIWEVEGPDEAFISIADLISGGIVPTDAGTKHGQQ
jgi:hypothetical protein